MTQVMSIPQWRTAAGKLIDVKDMATSHIINALAMLKRKGFISPKTIAFYMSCPLPNGEMAEDAFWMEFDMLSEQPVSEFIDIFEDELKKRGEL